MFRVYADDETCPYCGATKPDDDEPWYALECPTCLRDGCHECMPMGRGCECPECEEGWDE